MECLMRAGRRRWFHGATDLTALYSSSPSLAMKLHATLVGSSLSAMIAPPNARAEAATAGPPQRLGRMGSQPAPEEPKTMDGDVVGDSTVAGGAFSAVGRRVLDATHVSSRVAEASEAAMSKRKEAESDEIAQVSVG